MHKEHAYMKESFTSPCMHHTYKNTCMWACKHTSRFYCDHHLNWTHPAPPSGPDAPHCLHWTPPTSPSTLRFVLWIGHLIPNPLDRTPTVLSNFWTTADTSLITIWGVLLLPHPLDWTTPSTPFELDYFTSPPGEPHRLQRRLFRFSFWKHVPTLKGTINLKVGITKAHSIHA